MSAVTIQYIKTRSELQVAIPLLDQYSRIGAKNESRLVGFDIEFINQGQSFQNAQWILDKGLAACCLVQIAAPGICLLISLVHLGPVLPDNLIDIFTSESWIKAGVSVDTDLAYLSHNYNLGHCKGSLDLKHVATMANFANPSLVNLYNHLTGSTLEKDSSVCDWSQDLTKAMLTYAANDAILSYRLATDLLTPVFKLLEKDPPMSLIEMDNLIIGFEDPTVPESFSWITELGNFAAQRGVDRPIYQTKELTDKTFITQCYFLEHVTEGSSTKKKASRKIAAVKMAEIIGLN